MSTGTAVGSRPTCRNSGEGRAGFTLIETLVALALLLAFLSVLGPHLFHARRIADHVDGRVAAQVLLRAILDAPVDRTALAKGPRDGETGGLRWSVAAEPMFIDAMVPMERGLVQTAAAKATEPRPNWTAFRLIAKVSWGPGQMVSAETMRLGLDE
ncbi:prepilin-type N-terminal cleavage/methylation domain-containing protein [Bradyrhizobium prioriisuperbiae]|uniref:prepilin-type N-terminal cleavage/methylation domain-containing protein n=1 Tax=Bradyrhizobium prioriisuperbiae TaxID=2854389 RepID=UPI0028E78534|nr:prepilin-type N-terminal cleavage/methylation domain-containing protein [Bradyrhizobium prioritasuperba]